MLPADPNFLQVKNLTKAFMHEGKLINALRGVSFKLAKGKSLAICGSSGAGKSTLLSLIGGLDRPTSGEVFIQGKSRQKLTEQQEAEFRNQNLGFVFQFHYLLKDFNILENVMMPLLIQHKSKKHAKDQALEILERMKIADKSSRYPGELSGGEQQRAAIARALVHKPKIILADEPTGNLDEKNGSHVFDLLCRLNKDLGATLLVVTHHPYFAQRLDHILELESGYVHAFKHIEMASSL